MSAVVATAITTDYLNWDEISRDFMPTNELSRAFLASFILVMDLFIVMQVQSIPLKKGQENISSPLVIHDQCTLLSEFLTKVTVQVIDFWTQQPSCLIPYTVQGLEPESDCF